jgi:hypothetical protein
MNGLQLQGKWAEWAGKQTVATWLYAFMHKQAYGKSVL